MRKGGPDDLERNESLVRKDEYKDDIQRISSHQLSPLTIRKHLRMTGMDIF